MMLGLCCEQLWFIVVLGFHSGIYLWLFLSSWSDFWLTTVFLIWEFGTSANFQGGLMGLFFPCVLCANDEWKIRTWFWWCLNLILATTWRTKMDKMIQPPLVNSLSTFLLTCWVEFYHTLILSGDIRLCAFWISVLLDPCTRF